jgi:hypothetical protein
VHREAEGMLQPIYGKRIIFACLSTLFFSGFSQDHGTQNSWFNELCSQRILLIVPNGCRTVVSFEQFGNYQQNSLLNDVSCKNILHGFERKKELLKTLEKNESKMTLFAGSDFL